MESQLLCPQNQTWVMHTAASSAHPWPGFSFPVVFSLLVQEAQKQSWRWAMKKSGTVLISCTVEKLTLHLQIPSLVQTKKKRVPRFAVYVGTRPLVITSMSWHVKDARAFSGRVTCQLFTHLLPLTKWVTSNWGSAISFLGTISGPQLQRPRFRVWDDGPSKDLLISLRRTINIWEEIFIFYFPTLLRKGPFPLRSPFVSPCALE